VAAVWNKPTIRISSSCENS